MAGRQTQGMIAYQLTSLAVEDLFEIWIYIARDNPEAANAVEDAVYRACALLAHAPLAGRLRPDLTDLPLRFWFVQPYAITSSSMTLQPSRSRLFGCSMALETFHHYYFKSRTGWGFDDQKMVLLLGTIHPLAYVHLAKNKRIRATPNARKNP